MKNLLTRKTQWSDYMEDILRIITINYNEEAPPSRILMTQATYPYLICDVSVPQYNMGYANMLVSIKYLNFKYIGKTMSIQNIIQQHNSGVGSVFTEPLNLRPYDIFAHICEFDSKMIYYYTLKEYGKK